MLQTGGTNIIDAELDENLFLDDIRIMVCLYVVQLYVCTADWNVC